MRWFVEVASSGQQRTEQWVVEAEQWQPALQAARALRGDSSQMNGFSIELLEDGYRAIDPSTMVRYVIRLAPDRTPVTRPGSVPGPPPVEGTSGAPAARSIPGPGTVPGRGPASSPAPSQGERIAALLDVHGSGAPRPPRASAAPPRAVSGPSASVASPLAALTARSISQPAARASDAPAPPEVLTSERLASSSASPDADAVAPPRAGPASPEVDGLPHPSPGAHRSEAPLVAAVPSAPAPPPTGSPVLWPPLPPAELLFERAENPTPSSPLTYRESAWLVPEGTSIEAAVRLLAGTFEGVRAALAGVRPGKLVNMAVFDHRFEGKPQRPPLASLTWKDWRDQGQGPDIRRLGDPPHSMRPSFPPVASAPSVSVPPPAILMPSIPAPPAVPTAVGTAATAPTRPDVPAVSRAASLPRPEPAPARVPLAAIPAPPPAPPSSPSSPPAPPPPDPIRGTEADAAAPFASPTLPSPSFSLASGSAATSTEVTSGAAPGVAAASAQPSEGASAGSLAASPEQASVAARAADGRVAARAADGRAADGRVADGSFPASAGALPLAPVGSVRTPPPGSSPRQPSSGPQRSATPRPSRPSIPGKRLSGDELIADLFEVMHDLHFLRHPLEGADFVLSLIMEKIPSTVGLVHFYDIDAREFVVVRAVGPGAPKVMQIRTSEKEPLIAEAMHKRRAIVLRDADVARAKNGRWALLDVDTRSVICAPVAQGGRFLGVLEIANPRDGGVFSEGDGHALTYIGEQFSEFLGSRGTMLESDRSPSRPSG